MAYKPLEGEVFYCGKCNRQQSPAKGEICIHCRKLTVSWYTKRESKNDADRKWKQING
ncbi:MAG: hypothetical protein HQK65_16255 [Desulfamplus sp.]|nr:hypothetical protein [Desulfamplus sp.]